MSVLRSLWAAVRHTLQRGRLCCPMGQQAATAHFPHFLWSPPQARVPGGAAASEWAEAGCASRSLSRVLQSWDEASTARQLYKHSRTNPTRLSVLQAGATPPLPVFSSPAPSCAELGGTALPALDVSMLVPPQLPPPSETTALHVLPEGWLSP